MKKITIILVLINFTISCKTSRTTIDSSSKYESECPYQRFNFIGTTKVESKKGYEVLNNLSVALELEKNQILKSGKASDSLKIQVSNLLKETGNFEIPVSKEKATEYTQLASAICTLRSDLYAEKSIFVTEKQREAAADKYLDLLTYVTDIKKKFPN